jgi:hypothetical protein
MRCGHGCGGAHPLEWHPGETEACIDCSNCPKAPRPKVPHSLLSRTCECQQVPNSRLTPLRCGCGSPPPSSGPPSGPLLQLPHRPSPERLWWQLVRAAAARRPSSEIGRLYHALEHIAQLPVRAADMPVKTTSVEHPGARWLGLAVGGRASALISLLLGVAEGLL